MLCTKCNTENEPGVKYCINCGAYLYGVDNIKREKKSSNTSVIAIISLLIAIGSIHFFIFSIILAPIAILLAIVSLAEINSSHKKGKELAIVAIIISSIIAFVWIILFLAGS